MPSLTPSLILTIALAAGPASDALGASAAVRDCLRACRADVRECRATAHLARRKAAKKPVPNAFRACAQDARACRDCCRGDGDACPPSSSTTAPPATSSTSTTAPTTSTTLVTGTCRDGIVEGGETCDPAAVPNGCGGGTPYCDDCTACSATCSQLAFTIGEPTIDCGFPAQSVPASPPLAGELLDANGMPLFAGQLGLGCLYVGAGLASIVPPGATPAGAGSVFDVADCSANPIALGPSDTGDARSCTVGPAATRHCVNGHPGTDGSGACTSDGDCQPVCQRAGGGACDGAAVCKCVDGAPGVDAGTCNAQGICGPVTGCIGTACIIPCGSDADCGGLCQTDAQCGISSSSGAPRNVCLPDASCFFGNPIPIDSGSTSVCLINVVADGVAGTADKVTGDVEVTMPLRSRLYLTGIARDFVFGQPCPICENDACSAGARKGLACTTDSTARTTPDCPPHPSVFLSEVDVRLDPMSTDTLVRNADTNGVFCPAQSFTGAFGNLAVRTIVENGSPAAGGLGATPTDAVFAAVFCIPATGTGLVDVAANLPGPAANTIGVRVQLR